MTISRVRIEADAPTMEGVIQDLNDAFGLLFGSRHIPRDSEFVEEMVESHILADGAIEYSGRRVMRFFGGDGSDPAVPTPGDLPQPGLSPVSWVISGKATTATASSGTAIWNVGVGTANSMSIFPDQNWQIRDACGTAVDPVYSVQQAAGTYVQPFYFNPTPGIGG